MVTPNRNGTPEERSEWFRQMQKKSRLNYKGTGGFRALKEKDPARLKQITSMGGKSRWAKHPKNQE